MVHLSHVYRARYTVPLLLRAALLMALLGPWIRPVHAALPTTPSVPHIFVVMMENKTASQMANNPNAPYITRLMRQYGYAARYFGVAHPSLPNYLATVAGETFGSRSDDPTQRFDAPNVVDQLEAHRRSWKAYMGDLPSTGFGGDFAAPGYVIRHNPFMLMTDVRTNRTRARKVVPLTRLQTDLVGSRAPDFLYIVPALCDDMHPGPQCSSNVNDLIRRGDFFLSHLVPDIMGSSAWTANSVLFIVWDEADSGPSTGCCAGPLDGGGQVPAIVIVRHGPRHTVSQHEYNHYSLLRTVQFVWKLGCLAQTCSNAVTPMSDLVRAAGTGG